LEGDDPAWAGGSFLPADKVGAIQALYNGYCTLISPFAPDIDVTAKQFSLQELGTGNP